QDWLSLVQLCAASAWKLRRRRCVELRRICLECVVRLAECGGLGGDLRAASVASQRVLESVLLVCASERQDRLALGGALHTLLRQKFLPAHSLARLESATMSLSDSRVRNLLAPELLPWELRQ
ncbi:unnamed protein product, partial [Prorocentrum cordatum]